jgi:FtsP/CotA-like multicopper oxidase with cupredoxin domain
MTNTSVSSSVDGAAPQAAPNRREALQWVFGLTGGTAVASIVGCGGSSSTTADTLPDPQVLTSAGGLLSLDLNAQYGVQTMTVGNVPDKGAQATYPGTSSKVATSLRSFNGQYMAPTLVLNLGDTLRIKLNNKLPVNVSGQSKLSYLNYQNSTNLHFHGLHVDPSEFRPGVFGDYVVDHAEAGVKPGQSRQHELTIPMDHTNGIYWYHPHLHGSSNVQVSSGMFGAIIIRTAGDKFATSPEIRERVIHVHKLTAINGKIDSFYDSLKADASGFLLNGAFQPTIVMRPGEVQNWHFINTSSFYPFNPVLDDHTMLLYAKDGNVLDQKFKPVNLATSTEHSTGGVVNNQKWPGNVLYPGNRNSVIVKASSTPGTYYLRSLKAISSQVDDEIVARIVVEGFPVSTALPLASDLPRYADHLPITDAELASHGGKQRNLVLAILNINNASDRARLPQPIPAGEEWFIPKGEGVLEELVFASGDASATTKLYPFQSQSKPLTTTQTVALNAVEEWTIQNVNGYPHPFHIHVNDSYVVKVNGEAVTPYWADTIPVPPNGGSVTFRMRFTDFKGAYVWHCHALDHEDMGMMQLVAVV